eukprot:scaffold24012_cov186-Cylindrotheca_fusiformis.AAC.6
MTQAVCHEAAVLVQTAKGHFHPSMLLHCTLSHLKMIAIRIPKKSCHLTKSQEWHSQQGYSYILENIDAFRESLTGWEGLAGCIKLPRAYS